MKNLMLLRNTGKKLTSLLFVFVFIFSNILQVHAATLMLKDIDPGANGGNPSLLIDVNGTLYFTGNDGTNGGELWKSDGTENGTVMAIDINPGSGSSYPDHMININDIS